MVALKVFLLHPPPRLVWVPAAYPTPEGMIDGIIDGGKGLLACHMSVIGRPSPDERVELLYQVSGGRLRVCLDDFSDFVQECFHILGRRFDDDLAVVASYVLPQKVKSFLDMRDAGLFL